MSEPPPAAGDQGPPSPSSPPPPPQPQAVRAGLAGLPVAEATEEFWSQLEGEIEGEAPLQISPRPAIRPINEPPPTAGAPPPVDDVFERGAGRRSVVGRHPGGLSSAFGEKLDRAGSSRKRLAVLAVVAVLVALAALGGLFDGDDSDSDPAVETGSADETEPDEADVAPDDLAAEEEAPETTTTEATVPQPRSLEGEAPLHAGGVGLLETGRMTLHDVREVTGVEPTVNQNAFVASGGNCFDAVVPGADDLTLWFRNAAGDGLDHPDQGVLSVISVSGSSGRQTVAGHGLGTHELELHAHYEWRIQTFANPYHPRGGIYVAPDDESENAIGFVTGNEQIHEIRVGHEPLVSQANLCQL